MSPFLGGENHGRNQSPPQIWGVTDFIPRNIWGVKIMADLIPRKFCGENIMAEIGPPPNLRGDGFHSPQHLGGGVKIMAI